MVKNFYLEKGDSLDVIKIRQSLEQVLPMQRLEHTLGVEYTAASLAMCYGENIQYAALSGLLHDCAKYFSAEEQIQKCREYGITINQFEYKNPELLHAKLGAYIARTKYHIEEDAILQAISCHTTGKPNMNMLEKILYIADFIEPNRKNIPHLDEIRKLAFQDLDQCLFKILENSLDYLRQKNAIIDTMTEETYIYYKQRLNFF